MGRLFDIGIKPLEEGFDLELYVKGSLCGDDFSALRKYLSEEGYVEQAKQYIKQNNNAIQN